jgi:hypothetical protein
MRAKASGWLRGCACGALIWLATSVAHAQILDNVDVRPVGADAVIRVKFAVLIQYLRHVPSDRGSAVRVFFQVTAADDSSVGVVEEERRAAPTDLVPKFRVIYPAQAPGRQRYIDIIFDSAVDFRVQPEGNSTIALAIPLTAAQREKLQAAGSGAAPRPARTGPVVLPPPTAAPAAPTDIDMKAAADLAAARSALTAGDFDQAVLALNRALNLPPNAYSQEAQELIGVARERNGDSAKAQVEYQLYLKLYPGTPGAERVRQHLDAMNVPAAPVGGPLPGEPAIAQPAVTAWGSLSQYYYGGQSQSTTSRTIVTPATNATTLDTAKLTGTDQSQLVNNADLTARYRDGNWDNRLVVRDQYVANFMSGGSNRNWLNALYAETRYLPNDLMGRFGRQSATSGGVLGLFDGAAGSWGFMPNYRVNAVVGQPVDPPFNTSKTFYGASVDVDRLGDRAGGSLFAIRQVAAGETDRLGIGGELRYFDSARNVYSMIDYDPLFRAVNIGMVQGTWQFPTLTTINLLYDYRRAPTLQLTNALVADPGVSLSTLIQRDGVDAVRDQAKALTPISKQTLVGITQQVTPQWQLGFDARWSSLSGTRPYGAMPGVPATGSVWTYTAQAIGNGLTSLQDILVMNVGVLNGKQIDARQAGIDYRFVPWRTLSLEPALRWYHQTDSLGVTLTRWSPGLRLSYRIRDRLSLEGQFDYERTQSTGALVDDLITRQFWYVGWRWDF